MKPVHLAVLLFALLLAHVACEQRREPLPSIRDGVSNGTEEKPKEERVEAKEGPRRETYALEEEPEPEGDEDEYTPPAERSRLGEHEYTVVVGSFNRREMADQLSYELRMIRINNFIDKVNGKWEVCVGQYRSRGLAKNTLKRVRDKGYEQAVIVGPGREK
jgi:cell division protein FtsN